MSPRYSRHPHTVTYLRIVRRDPCSYCGGHVAHRPMTVDHIRPLHGRERGDLRSWRNLTSACATCNNRKGATALLWFLLAIASLQGGGR